MHDDIITIDIDKLRSDLKAECLGMYYGGGFGTALIESFDIDSASPVELFEMAQRQRFDLLRYKV